MAELVLPGVYIEVRPEALIVGGPISVGNIGIVGTAAAGTPGKVEVLSSLGDALEKFGPYDNFDSPTTAGDPLTLVRALEVAYNNGASNVLAVRVAQDGVAVANATRNVATATGNAVKLTAVPPGSFGNKIKITVDPVAAEPGPPPLPVRAKVTLKYKAVVEIYTVKDGNELLAQINASSTIVTAEVGNKPAELPVTAAEADFTGGEDGANASPADYKKGFDVLLNEDAHIIVAAGLDDTQIGADLKAHVESASTDKIKRDRIAVVGSALGATNATKPTQFSDRLIFVAPGIKVTDSAKAATTPDDSTVTLPGAYTAAAIAGMLSARDPHISLTNKTVSAKGLEKKFNSSQLEQLLKSLVLVLEERKGIRVVKAITTNDGAFRQITTRRIVDFAKFGVRSAAEPYIGLLNNDRVRKALKGSINGFLAGMVDDEMLVSYELDVTATRDEEIRGIARVTMTVRPTFSIDYIKVVMFLG